MFSLVLLHGKDIIGSWRRLQHRMVVATIVATVVYHMVRTSQHAVSQTVRK
jgi:hypothetical protein